MQYLNSRVNLEVLHPQKWWLPTLYQLKQPVKCAGHTVPAGFKTDGATVSRWFSIVGVWLLIIAHFTHPAVYALGFIGVVLPAIFPSISNYLKATIVHDYYLDLGVSRKTADLIFKDCLTELGIKKWRANAMYYAVRVYGVTITLKKHLAFK